jgi:hypothetical protein
VRNPNERNKKKKRLDEDVGCRVKKEKKQKGFLIRSRTSKQGGAPRKAENKIK